MIHTAHSLNEANLLAQAIVNTIREPLLVLDADLRVLAATCQQAQAITIPSVTSA